MRTRVRSGWRGGGGGAGCGGRSQQATPLGEPQSSGHRRQARENPRAATPAPLRRDWEVQHEGPPRIWGKGTFSCIAGARHLASPF